MKTTKLPRYDAVNHKYFNVTDHYKAYRVWRKSTGYKLWLRKQWKSQDGKCYYCKANMKGQPHNVEHVVPQSWGGNTNSKNIVLSCPACNKAKGANLPAKKFRLNKKPLSLTQKYRRAQ